MTPAPVDRSEIAVTVASAATGPDDCWAVVDAQGRALRLPEAALDPRLRSLHLGQRLRATVSADGVILDAYL